MGKGIKAGKATKPSKTYTQAEVDKLLKIAENNCNEEIKRIRKRFNKGFKKFEEISFHNCDLLEQVVLYVALKRTFHFGEQRMCRVGHTAQGILDDMADDKITFDDLIDELATVGFEVDSRLWEWEQNKEEIIK